MKYARNGDIRLAYREMGTGLSDPVSHVPPIDERMDDLRAVVTPPSRIPGAGRRFRGRPDLPGVRDMFGREQRACASPMMAKLM